MTIQEFNTLKKYDTLIMTKDTKGFKKNDMLANDWEIFEEDKN